MYKNEHAILNNVYSRPDLGTTVNSQDNRHQQPPSKLEGDQDGTREVKVKLPVEQILKLHYTRMKKRKNFSVIVSNALTRYFDEMNSP